MIKCIHTNKEYDNQSERLKAIIDHKSDIIAMKKAAIKMSDSVAMSVEKELTKSVNAERLLEIGDTIEVVINTTNYLDSHDDVHMTGIWTKSVKEQQGKVYHVTDHNLSLGNVVAYPKDVEMYVESVPWQELGYAYSGNTEALKFRTKITDKTNLDAFRAYRDNVGIQHSIRMSYVDIKMAINDESDKEGFALWNATINQIVNREKAEAQGFYFVVKEAKICQEGSTVLLGSNDATPYLGFTRDNEPSVKGTQGNEPKEIDFVAMCKQVSFK